MFCNYCGAQLPDNSRFCNHCGSPLPQVQPPVQNPVQAPVQPQMPPQMQPQMPPRATWPMAQKTEKPEKQSFLRIANILVSVLGLGFLLVFALNFWIAAFGGVSSRELTNGKISSLLPFQWQALIICPIMREWLQITWPKRLCGLLFYFFRLSRLC